MHENNLLKFLELESQRPNYNQLLKLFREAQEESLRRVHPSFIGDAENGDEFFTLFHLDSTQNLINKFKLIQKKEKYGPILIVNAQINLLLRPDRVPLIQTFAKGGYEKFCFLLNPDVEMSDDEGIKRFYKSILYIDNG